MMRTLLGLVSVICVATVLSELAGLGLLWYRGQLTAATVADIRAILSGEYAGEVDGGDDGEGVDSVAAADVIEKRSMAVMGLSNRAQELDLLKAILDENARQLSEQQAEFELKQEAFETRLADLEETVNEEATEQTRAVLARMDAPDAVQNLMELDLQENLVLLKGMSDKKIAELLQQFLEGDQAQITRGHEIFEGLSRGDPANSLVEATAGELTQDVAAEAPPAN